MSTFTGRGQVRRLAVFCAFAAVASLALTAPVAALSGRAAATRASAAPPPELLGGVTVTGATITTPGQPVRTLDASHATAFMQAWLPDSVYTKLPNVNPPGKLPVSHLTVVTRWRNADYPLKVLYATDGTTAWVGMPAQNFGWAGVESLRWIAAPQSKRVQDAFAGKLEATVQPAGPTTTAASTVPKAPATSHSSGSSSAGWVIGGLVLVVGVGVLIAFTRRRKPSGTTAASTR